MCVSVCVCVYIYNYYYIIIITVKSAAMLSSPEAIIQGKAETGEGGKLVTGIGRM